MRAVLFSVVIGMAAAATLLPLHDAVAQEVFQELQGILRAEVVEIVAEREEIIMGTDALTTVQTLRVELREGERSGEVVEFENDRIMLEAGDGIYVTHLITTDGLEYFYLHNVERHGPLLALALLFVGLIVWFARWQGVRALLSLAVSIAAILFLLIPAMLAGYDPVWVSVLIAGLILMIVLFGTHGINALSLSALGGTWGAVILAVIVATTFVDALRLSGFGADATVYLNFATEGRLDFTGLLLGSIIIGILGVLDDVSITQASVVQELKHANPAYRLRQLYQRAIKVGRDHVGSLVNTLALAYVGAALPLVLLFATSNEALAVTLNQEVIVAELVRIMVGSIGLVLAVPLTTLLAAWWFDNREVGEADLAHGHSHHH